MKRKIPFRIIILSGLLATNMPVAAHQLNNSIQNIPLSAFSVWHNTAHAIESTVAQHSLSVGTGLIILGSILVYWAAKSIHLHHKLLA